MIAGCFGDVGMGRRVEKIMKGVSVEWLLQGMALNLERRSSAYIQITDLYKSNPPLQACHLQPTQSSTLALPTTFSLSKPCSKNKTANSSRKRLRLG